MGFSAIRGGGRERGVTLLETLIAVVVLIVGITAVAGLFAVAAGKNKGYGEIATRSTEYAQDKMEQLLALQYADSSTNTTVYPSAATGGTGLGGNMAGNATVGSINPSAPATGYVDYLDASGNLLTSSTGAYYTRQWSIATDSTATLKTVTVFVTASSVMGGGVLPSTTLVSQKTLF